MQYHLRSKRRRAAISTAIGTLIFIAAAMAVSASFNVIEMHSSANLQTSILAADLLDGKNGESVNASWTPKNQNEILATNTGDRTAMVVDITSIDSTTGSVTQLIPESIIVPEGSTVTICKSSGCPVANSKTGLITSLGNVIWVVSPESRPAFDVALGNASSTTIRGGSNATTVTLTSVNGYNYRVMLYAGNPPPGVNITFVPQIFTPTSSGATSSMILVVSLDAPSGKYSIDVLAKGADGTTNSTTYLLTITS